MLFPKIEYKTLVAYASFFFDYGLKFSFKIILYEYKYRNFYKDYTPKHIPNNKLNVKNYDKEKITGYSPTYYYYLNLSRLFFKRKNIKFDNLYDIGFGTGRVLYFFQFLVDNIYGFEISKKLFLIGKKRLKKMISKNKKLNLSYLDALKYSKYKDNSLIFIFDPFTKVDDLDIILENVSHLKNSHLIYANPRFRNHVKRKFKEVFFEKNHNFRGISIFKI